MRSFEYDEIKSQSNNFAKHGIYFPISALYKAVTESLEYGLMYNL